MLCKIYFSTLPCMNQKNDHKTYSLVFQGHGAEPPESYQTVGLSHIRSGSLLVLSTPGGITKSCTFYVSCFDFQSSGFLLHTFKTNKNSAIDLKLRKTIVYCSKRLLLSLKEVRRVELRKSSSCYTSSL